VDIGLARGSWFSGGHLVFTSARGQELVIPTYIHGIGIKEWGSYCMGASLSVIGNLGGMRIFMASKHGGVIRWGSIGEHY